MIDRLKTLLESATKPSRELDCMMHECLTGQVNECRATGMRAVQESLGRMLLERGGELLWTEVPRYTEVVDACYPLLQKHIGISYLNDSRGPRFMVRVMHEDRPVDFAGNCSAALTLCLAIVSFRCSR